MKQMAVLFFVLINNVAVFAQANHRIGIAYTAGRIIKHTKKLTYNPPNYADNIEINYTKKRTGNERWIKNYHQPTTGFTFSILDYKDKNLGKAFSIMPTIAFSLFQKKQFILDARLGGGVAYATKYWHRQPYADSINNYLGSAINLYASVNCIGHYTINHYWQAEAGIALNHISNAGIRKPNFGINLIGAYVGVCYAIGNAKNSMNRNMDTANKLLQNIRNVSLPSRKIGVDIRLGATMAEYGTGDGPLLPIYTGAIFGTYIYKQKHKFLFGIDYELNGKTLTFIRTTKQATNNEILDASYICAVVGNEFLFGNFSIPVQVGVYVNSAYLQSTKTYNKFGLFYYPYLHKKQYGRGMYLGTLLKTNAFNADFLEMNIGYSF
jgi:Lipid A 3-O-deacylase (PagL)